MTRIPENERDLIEKAIYLPMVITVLNRDLTIFESSPFKLRKPYLELVENTIKLIQKELYEVKQTLRKSQIQVKEINRDESFTMFLFLYKGFEEQHNYFNPRIRNKVQELMEHYLCKKYISSALD